VLTGRRVGEAYDEETIERQGETRRSSGYGKGGYDQF
jgi:hypothetical protein